MQLHVYAIYLDIFVAALNYVTKCFFLMTLKDTISGFNLVPLAKRRFGRELCDGFFTSNTLNERTFCSVNLTMNGCSFNKIYYIYTF